MMARAAGTTAAASASPVGPTPPPVATVPKASAADFRALFEQNASYVHHSLRRLGVRAEDLDDATQEVFVVLFRRLADYDPSRPLRLWLFGVALRVASQARRRTRPVECLDDHAVADAAPLADEGLEKGEMRDRVLLALDALDVERKAIFVMHDIDEFPVPAIAAQLEIPVNTAYSRLRLAREDFRRAMLRLGKGSAP